MNLVHLSAKNFLSLNSVELPLSQRGLVLVLGRNTDAEGADSNGSGKSSLFDAMCWCLWGTTTRGVKGDEVVSLLAKKDCEVTVSVEDGESLYEIKRIRKHSGYSKSNDLLLTVNGEDGRGATISDTQDRVNRLLGLDFHTFRAMMPGAGINAAALTDREIKNLLENILGTSSFAQAQAISRDLKKDLSAQVEEHKAVRDQQVLRLEDARERYSKYQDAIAAFVAAKKDRQALIDSKLQQAAVRVQELTEKASTLADVETKITEIKAKIDQADLLYHRFAKELSERKDVFTDMGTKLSNGLNLLNFKVSEKEHLLGSLLSLGDTCATCGQSVDQAQCATDIQQLQDDLSTLRSQTALDEATLAGAKIEWEGHSEALTKKLGDVETLKSTFHEQLLVQMKLQGSLENLDSELEKVQSELELLRAERVKVDVEQSPMADLLLECGAQIDALEEELTSIDTQIEALSDQMGHADFWINGFSAQGLRSYALSKVCPLLNERVAHYAKLVSGDDLNIVFSSTKKMKNNSQKELFNIEVKQAHGAKSYVGSSSGERARADLAISFALGDLAALRATKKIPFKFLDEAFGSVDESGIDAIMALLHDQSKSYGTIFVVTHKDYLKRYIDNSLTVVKENGQSRLEV